MITQNDQDGSTEVSGKSALVFVNSFDPEKDDIEEEVTSRKLLTEVFEIDRVRNQDRDDYLNCLKEMYGTMQLPMVFIGDHMVGGLAELRKMPFE